MQDLVLGVGIGAFDLIYGFSVGRAEWLRIFRGFQGLQGFVSYFKLAFE